MPSTETTSSDSAACGQERAHARVVEDRLGDDHAVQQADQRQAADGDHRDQGVGHGMLADHHVFGQPLARAVVM